MGGVALRSHAASAGGSDPIPLARARAGERVRLVRTHAGRGLQAHLASLGLLPGCVFSVVTADPQGPVIVALGESRVALGRGMAHKIFVEPVPA